MMEPKGYSLSKSSRAGKRDISFSIVNPFVAEVEVNSLLFAVQLYKIKLKNIIVNPRKIILISLSCSSCQSSQKIFIAPKALA